MGSLGLIRGLHRSTIILGAPCGHSGAQRVIGLGMHIMTGDDRRGDLRGVREERLFIKLLDCEANSVAQSTTLSGSTLDVSASGMRLLLGQTLPSQALLEIWIEIKGCPGKYVLYGVVQWCHPVADEFICGIELQETKEVSDLADWQDLFR